MNIIKNKTIIQINSGPKRSPRGVKGQNYNISAPYNSPFFQKILQIVTRFFSLQRIYGIRNLTTYYPPSIVNIYIQMIMLLGPSQSISSHRELFYAYLKPV